MSSKTLLHAISIATGVAIGVAVTEAITFQPIDRFPEVMTFKPMEQFRGSEHEMRSGPVWNISSVDMVPRPLLNAVMTENPGANVFVNCSDMNEGEQISSFEESLVNPSPSNHSNASTSTRSTAGKIQIFEKFMEGEQDQLKEELDKFLENYSEKRWKHLNESNASTSEIKKRIGEFEEIENKKFAKRFMTHLESELRESYKRYAENKDCQAE